MMAKIILFNKPFQVLCQFSDENNRKTLKDYINLPNIYPAGRLDYDSEGLVILTDDGKLQHQISHPDFHKEKAYWVQVDGDIDERALALLRAGVNLKDGLTLPCQASKIPEPSIWPRNPPIRYRAAIPTSWIHIILTEGKNRQIRRMTAAAGFPTLRIIRYKIGQWQLDSLAPGCFREI